MQGQGEAQSAATVVSTVAKVGTVHMVVSVPKVVTVPKVVPERHISGRIQRNKQVTTAWPLF